MRKGGNDAFNNSSQEGLRVVGEVGRTTPPSAFEHARDLICGILANWPYPSQAVSLLLCGPSGNGKSYLVRAAAEKVRTQDFHRHVIAVMPSLAHSLSRRHADGSTAFRKDIRRAIQTAVMNEELSLPNSSGGLGVSGGTEFAVLVVLDHMELFLSATSDAATPAQGSGPKSGLVVDVAPLNPSVLCDLYDVLRGRELFDRGELSAMNLKVVLFVTLFSGSYDDVDPFARAKLFCSHVSLNTPTERERLTFFTEHGDLPYTLCTALAARTGGIIYRGLVEIIEHAKSIFCNVVSEEGRLLLSNEDADSARNDGSSDYSNASNAVGLAVNVSLHVIRAFAASDSAAARDFRRSVGYVDVQQTRWDDIAGLDSAKSTLKRLVLQPLQSNLVYQRFGLQPSTGVLLYGPPGTGKTMLARAIATELNASFIYLDLPQLIQAEMGESERRLREFFDAARDRSPSVMFIDELQAAFGARSRTASVHDSRLVSQFLNLLDAAREDSSYFTLFVGATNVVHTLDGELLRAGRLDTMVEVPPLDEEARLRLVRRVVYGEWVAWAAYAATEAAGNLRCGMDGMEALTRRLVDGTVGFSGAQLRQTLNVFALQFLRLRCGTTTGSGNAASTITLQDTAAGMDASESQNRIEEALRFALSSAVRY
ncbi:Cell division control protein 48, putative [Trypanosoma equiperdum]|uniref:Cell division control protein 48, putative n=1 Tax=Trypanosoma equiperdum TaxID=5694 RepID=A0A1G4IAU0_TRYEQ|nr:Cell division control protein 48, putative [Trypanosoma equiperdum]